MRTGTDALPNGALNKPMVQYRCGRLVRKA